MGAVTDLLSTLGPVGVFAAAFVIILAGVWRLSGKVEQVNSRLDNLDHHERGRVPKVERRVDEHDEELSEIRTDLAVIRTDTQWIRKALGDTPSAAATPARRRKGAS